jgi:lipoprotein NlpD
VRAGDTLYSIAWRYSKDFRELAHSNGIGNDYRIYPGQLLRLDIKRSGTTVKGSRTTRRKNPASKKSVARSPTTSSPSANNTPSHSPVQATVAKRPVTKKNDSSARGKSEVNASAPLRWRWPAKGKVVGYFNAKDSVNKGLNIDGRTGDPVIASAPGRVVYAGSGLLGYGNLIIINHNQQFLSAYAHNRKIFVKEKQQVKVGQIIAEMGRSGTTQTMLHFEIRKDGRPVNPLRYLPKRL